MRLEVQQFSSVSLTCSRKSRFVSLAQRAPAVAFLRRESPVLNNAARLGSLSFVQPSPRLMKSVRTMARKRLIWRRIWVQVSQTSIAQLPVHGSPAVKGCAVKVFPHCGRSFKLPNNSGPVGAVRAMPNDYSRIIYVDELLWLTSFLFTLILTLWDTIIQRALQMRLKGSRRPCVV